MGVVESADFDRRKWKIVADLLDLTEFELAAAPYNPGSPPAQVITDPAREAAGIYANDCELPRPLRLGSPYTEDHVWGRWYQLRGPAVARKKLLSIAANLGVPVVEYNRRLMCETDDGKRTRRWVQFNRIIAEHQLPSGIVPMVLPADWSEIRRRARPLSQDAAEEDIKSLRLDA
jgi:hypothetical protein